MKNKMLKPRNHVARQPQSGAGRHKDKRRRTWLLHGMREAKEALRRSRLDELTRERIDAAIRKFKYQGGMVL
jgi:hypothetical protein